MMAPQLQPALPARPAPADIGTARDVLYDSFQIWLWSRGAGTMDEIESDLRGGRLAEPFRQWLRTRTRRSS
jgi:hypothetical protein